MTTLGLREAHETARVIRLWIDPELDVRVATVPMLTVLKLIAWNDDPNVRRKDALDIAFMLKRYLDAGNEKRIFDDHLDLVTDDFDHEVASARLLGRDALTMMEAETCEAVLDILKRELLAPERSRLIVHMTDGGRRLAFERGVQMLEAFRQGLVDRAGVRR